MVKKKKNKRNFSACFGEVPEPPSRATFGSYNSIKNKNFMDLNEIQSRIASFLFYWKGVAPFFS